jgi:hypothetical protein
MTSSFLHDRVRQLLFAAPSTLPQHQQVFVDAQLRLQFAALRTAADHSFSAQPQHSAGDYEFYSLSYAGFVQVLAQQCAAVAQLDVAADSADVGEIAALLLRLTADLDNVCRSMFTTRYRSGRPPKKLREVLARFFDDLQTDDDAAMFVLLRLLHHTCGALNSINFRNLSWHGFLSAHEIRKLVGFAALLQTLLLNLQRCGAVWLKCEAIPRIDDLLPVFVCENATFGAVGDDEWRALVQQSPLVHRASGQEELFNGVLQLFRRDRRRDFCALAFTTIEAALRVQYVSANAILQFLNFQIDYDTLFISYTILLHDWLPALPNAQQSGADADADDDPYAYRLVPGTTNVLTTLMPGDLLCALRELVQHLELRDRLAHGLLPTDADISSEVMLAVFSVLVALLRCPFVPMPEQRVARTFVPRFGAKRMFAEQLRRLEYRTEPIADFYRALGVDSLFLHEEHGRLARIATNLCELRATMESQRAAHPEHAYFAALHDHLYARCALLLRTWLAECETARGAVTSVRLGRIETLTEGLRVLAQQLAGWKRMCLLIFLSGLSARDAREEDYFGGFGSSALARADARFANLVQ